MKRYIMATALMVIGMVTPVSGQDLLPIVQEERAKFSTPTLTAAQTGAAVYNVARIAGTGWAVIYKDYGHNCPSPAGPISCDIVVEVRTGREFEIFIDSGEGGVNEPTFHPNGLVCGVPPSGCETGRLRIVALHPPAPTPPSPPQQVDLTPILTRLDEQARLIQLILDKPCVGLTREDYDNLIRILTADRRVEVKGGWLVGTLRGFVFGGGQ